MAQGEFTKSEATETIAAVEEMFRAMPKRLRGEYLGHANDILLFLGAAKKAAPDVVAETGR